ncbi:MAG: hypothetical protein IPI90_15765 [Saprospiraceae bacterium]|nr:hypothetical protein [Candidatus Vicinibacter affinis]
MSVKLKILSWVRCDDTTRPTCNGTGQQIANNCTSCRGSGVEMGENNRNPNSC